jgi:RND family efflux transporter MFP subunit
MDQPAETRSAVHLQSKGLLEEAGAEGADHAPEKVGKDQHLARPLKSQLAAAARRRVVRAIVPWTKRLATLAIMVVAILMGLVTWDYYVAAPWTRNGRVRVQVASVAPQVSGQIVELRVIDNQYVHKGDVLYVIDPFDFEVALRADTALLQEKAADLQVKRVQSERRQNLSAIATSAEEQQIFAGTAVQAKAAFQAAQEKLAQTEINLRRTQVRSPVNGYVTNLLMRVGDYAHQGTTNISVIDSDSYWIDGYFEETKMVRICVGDRAEAKLMGYAQPITGHVTTVTRGIGVSNAMAGAQGLPNVDPVYTWVRLAQRVPVRISIDNVPRGIPLVSGMTATVTILKTGDSNQKSEWDHVVASVRDRLSDVFDDPPIKPDCIPAITTERGPTQSLPVEVQKPGLSPGQINPNLAPGMGVSPRTR